jgi:hypothetical protein
MLAESGIMEPQRYVMKLCVVWLLFALCLPPFAALQHETTVPVVDKAGAGSPLEVSGALTLQEAARGNELEWSWGEKVAVKNVSGKPILLFVAVITEIGRHSAGYHAAPGDGSTYQLGEDRFFSDALIRPGESLILRDTSPGTPHVACCINPLVENGEPTGGYRLRFVQFADGSTFGDSADAEDVLTVRQTTLRDLRELVQSYAGLGPQGFAAKLMAQSAFSDTAVCKQILAKYREGGAQAALGKAKRILAAAEHNAAMITGTAAEHR